MSVRRAELAQIRSSEGQMELAPQANHSAATSRGGGGTVSRLPVDGATKTTCRELAQVFTTRTRVKNTSQASRSWCESSGPSKSADAGKFHPGLKAASSGSSHKEQRAAGARSDVGKTRQDVPAAARRCQVGPFWIYVGSAGV